MAQLIPSLEQKFFDANGDPLVGGKLYSYIAGTSTPQETYTDFTGSTPNTNPVILDANGGANIWVGTQAYKFVLTDADDVVIWTRDGVIDVPDGSITNAKIADNSISTIKIQDDAVTTAKIPNLAITTAKIADNAITNAKIPNNSLGFDKLANEQVEIVYTNPGDEFPSEGITGIPQFKWETPLKISGISSSPAGIGRSVNWGGNGKTLIVAHDSSPYFKGYERSGSTFTNRLTMQNDAPASNARGAAWSPDGQHIAIAVVSSPFIHIYTKEEWAALAEPIPPYPVFYDLATSVAWSPDGKFLALSHSGTPYLTVFQIVDGKPAQIFDFMTGGISNSMNNVAAVTGNTIADINAAITTINVRFRTVLQLAMETYFRYKSRTHVLAALPNPASLPVGPTACASWSPDGKFLAVGVSISPYVEIYLRTGTTFTKLGGPASNPGSAVRSISFSQNGEYMAVAQQSSPYISIYEISGTTFTKLANPAALPTGEGRSVSWSLNSEMLAVGHDTAPYATIYRRSGSTFTKEANLTDVLPGNVQSLAFSPTCEFLAIAHQAGSYLSIYKTSYVMPKNAILISKERFNG